MPKSTDKKKSAQAKRKASRTSDANGAGNGTAGEETTAPKKRKLQNKTNYRNEIAMSKQLASKSRNPRNRSYNSSKKNEPRVCGNGKEMPPLSELEKMFEDTDSDEEPTSTAKTNIPERPETPRNPIPMIEDKIVSPKTIKHIASKLMDMISKNDIIPIVDDGPPPPVIPQKKQKKSDIPYIVGCKERPQVPWQPKTNFCKGDEDYGVDKNAKTSDDEESSCCSKRRYRGKKVNLSKSIFNAQSDEIAERLKTSEYLEAQLNGSPESTNTEPYDYSDNSASNHNMMKHFEPLASTSTDSVTIDINDRLFNQSLKSEPSNNTQDDLEVIEIDDTMCDIDEKEVIVKNSQEDCIEDDSCIIIESTVNKESQNNNDGSVDCCVIIDSDSVMKNENNNNNIKILIEDDLPNYDFSTIDLTDHQYIDSNEIIDIDDIIAENEVTISKYRTKSSLDTVTLVEPSTSAKSQPQNVSNNNSSKNVETNVQKNKNVTESAPVNVQDTGYNADRIANVVADFFAQPENERNNPNNIVDLTGSPVTMINKITSWISTIQSYINGSRNCSSQEQGCNDPSIVNQVTSNFSRNSDEPRLQSVTTIPPRRNSRTQNNGNQQASSVPPADIVLHETFFPASTATVVNSSAPPNRQMPSQSSPDKRLGECPICMESLLNSPIASTICGHVFCMRCIKAAVKANGKKCPNCRMKFKGVGYHQLFL